MQGYMYQIINRINQKRYIGQTIDINAIIHKKVIKI